MLFVPGAFAEDAPMPGQYGQLFIAIRGGAVYGVFSESRIGNGTDRAPQFSCIFLMQGPLVDNKASVQTWFPADKQRISGTLELGSNPSLKLTENHPGCEMTSGDMVSERYSLMLDTRHDEWIGVGIVTEKKAVLRKESSDAGRKRSPYLVKFDAFAVLERKPGWVRVQYLGENDDVTGWVRDQEVSTAPAEISLSR